MSEKDQFERERDVRVRQQLDARFVVGTLAAFAAGRFASGVP